MGDRCSMIIYCREQDVQLINGALGGCEIRRDNEGVSLHADEVNYAASVGDRCHGQFPKGIPFYGYHSSSCCAYGPGEFSTDGITMRYEETSMGDHEHIIGFDTLTGEPDKDDIARVKSYIEHWRKVYEMVHGRPFGPVHQGGAS